MNRPRIHRLVIAVAILITLPAVRADLITLDLCPGGKGSNVNIYGTTLSGNVATWGSNYRDYQFYLQTTSGSANFDQFEILLSAQLRQTGSSNSLRASLWPGLITGNPLLSEALTTITVPNATISSSGFSNKVTLTGSPFAPQPITSTVSPFFFRVWAEGGNNGGYQTKMATLPTDMQFITMSSNPVIDGGIGIDNDGNGTLDVIDPMSETVPEIDPSGLVSVLALAGGALGLLERRRRSDA